MLLAINHTSVTLLTKSASHLYLALPLVVKLSHFHPIFSTQFAPCALAKNPINSSCWWVVVLAMIVFWQKGMDDFNAISESVDVKDAWKANSRGHPWVWHIVLRHPICSYNVCLTVVHFSGCLFTMLIQTHTAHLCSQFLMWQWWWHFVCYVCNLQDYRNICRAPCCRLSTELSAKYNNKVIILPPTTCT